jgi:hypothetical protein
MTTVTVHTPAPVAVPRFAPVAATMFAQLLLALEGLGHTLAKAGRRRG